MAFILTSKNKTLDVAGDWLPKASHGFTLIGTQVREKKGGGDCPKMNKAPGQMLKKGKVDL